METDTSALVISLLGKNADPVIAARNLRLLGDASPVDCSEILESLFRETELVSESDPAILGGLFLAFQRLVARCSPEHIAALDIHKIETVDRNLPLSTPNRHRWLYPLAAAKSKQSLQALSNILIDRPPATWVDTGQLLSPLFLNKNWEPADFFPGVLSAIEHRSVASPLLDLANFLFRNSRVAVHPAADRCESLCQLLGHVAGRLSRFEEDPRFFGDRVDEVQRVLGEAVALAVSLCDALGLIGSDIASGKLHQALELKHRRVQTEAAGALARLGVELGRQRLLELAAEPSARLRVIAYAEELGFADAIDDQYKTPEATAEADLALWLAQPQNMGAPPTSVEVVDRRRLYWPSFDSPVDCNLVKFSYDLGQRHYSNIGITGPLVHTIAADLTELPVDDIYSIYAGWQVEHADIFRVDAKHWNAAQQRLVKPLLEHFDRLGLDQITPATLGFFVGEHALIVRAIRKDQPCIAITDGAETIEISTSHRLRPFDTDDLWHLYLGRKLLRTFNDQEDYDDA
jgi:hypothetical protein